MARTKNDPSSPPPVGSTGKKIWKILQTKRSSSKSATDSSQSQASPQVNLPTARKSTGKGMVEVAISDSESETDASVVSSEEEEEVVQQTARKSTAAVMVQKPIATAVRQERGKKVAYTAKDGTVKRRYAPGILRNFFVFNNFSLFVFSGAAALREIRRLQSETTTTIPKASFVRVVREISQQLTKKNFKYTVGSLMALHVSLFLICILFPQLTFSFLFL
jgi:Core histone H2A/H2B/H3/H4